MILLVLLVERDKRMDKEDKENMTWKLAYNYVSSKLSSIYFFYSRVLGVFRPPLRHMYLSNAPSHTVITIAAKSNSMIGISMKDD